MRDTAESSTEHLRRQAILAKFAELALKSEDLDEIFTESCRLVGDALGTHLAKVVELQEDGVTLIVRAGVGWKPGVVGVATIKATDDTSEGHALRTGEPMISPDIATEARFRYPPFLVENGVKAVANVPILGGEGKTPFGILQVDSREPREFTDSDTAFLTGYANLLAGAVQRLSNLRDLRHLVRLNAMGAMAASLAHELNQPLAAISNYAAGCATILEENGIQVPKLKDGLDAIADASNRAGDIIRNLREMTRNHKPHSNRFPMNAALADAVGLVRAAGCEGVKIDFQTKTSGWVNADRIEIEQVIINLIKNACEAVENTGSSGTVTGSIHAENGEVRLTIQDDGQGIPDVRATDIFDSAYSSKLNGMGIGLSISRTIIERYGGRMALDKTSAEGSSFSFWLPESSIAGKSPV